MTFILNNNNNGTSIAISWLYARMDNAVLGPHSCGGPHGAASEWRDFLKKTKICKVRK